MDVSRTLDGTEWLYVSSMSNQEMFGHIPCIIRRPSRHRYQSKTVCKLAHLPLASYEKIKRLYPNMHILMMKAIESDKEPVVSFVRKNFGQFKIFEDLSRETTNEISHYFWLNKYKLGQNILKPGDQFQSVYMVMEGVVSAYL